MDLIPQDMIPDPVCRHPFYYNGYFSNVIETADGGHRLIHLIDGKWANGRQIALPGLAHSWQDDAERGRKRLSNRTSKSMRIKQKRITQQNLFVETVNGEHHIFLTDRYSFSAYRRGFEFVAEKRDFASALSPENSVHEVSGWEPIDRDNTNIVWSRMRCDNQGATFFQTFAPKFQLVRRQSNGRCDRVTNCFDLRHSIRSILSEPSRSCAYVINNNQGFNTLILSRLVENTVQPPHFKIEGCKHEYFQRWRTLFLGLLIAWLVHLLVLTVGTDLLEHRNSFSVESIQMHSAEFATIRRRSLSAAFDTALIGLIVLGLTWIQLKGTGFFTPLFVEENWTDMFAAFETTIRNDSYVDGWGTLLGIPSILKSVIFGWEDENDDQQLVLKIAVLEFLLLFIGRSYIEGRFGRTPGKWLFGIRTLRTTLKPVGFARTLVRDALYCVDMPFLLTPIPAAICMMLSGTRQRLGDLVADTIVVKAGSIRNDSNALD